MAERMLETFMGKGLIGEGLAPTGYSAATSWRIAAAAE
jgi:hypothetical protein